MGGRGEDFPHLLPLVVEGGVEGRVIVWGSDDSDGTKKMWGLLFNICLLSFFCTEPLLIRYTQ